jgi:hypothetical protein
VRLALPLGFIGSGGSGGFGNPSARFDSDSVPGSARMRVAAGMVGFSSGAGDVGGGDDAG